MDSGCARDSRTPSTSLAVSSLYPWLAASCTKGNGGVRSIVASKSSGIAFKPITDGHMANHPVSALPVCRLSHCSILRLRFLFAGKFFLWLLACSLAGTVASTGFGP